MLNDQDYVQVKEEAESWLFKMPQVYAVGLGPKFVGGRAIGKLSIQVFVESKRPRSSLNADEIIPELIENVPTDVLEWQCVTNTQAETSVDNCPTGVIQSISPIDTGPNPTDFEMVSPSHGLFTGARIRFTGPSDILPTTVSQPVTVKNQNTFTIENVEFTLPYVENSAGWINVSTMEICAAASPEKSNFLELQKT